MSWSEVDPSALSSAWWLFRVTWEYDQPPSQKGASPGQLKQDRGTEQLPSLCTDPQASSGLAGLSLYSLSAAEMLRVSDTQQHSPGWEGRRSCRNAKPLRLSFSGLGVQMLTVPSAPGAVPADKAEPQDWPLPTQSHRARLSPQEPLGRDPALHCTLIKHRQGLSQDVLLKKKMGLCLCQGGRVCGKWL